jgi:hypothetical protein
MKDKSATRRIGKATLHTGTRLTYHTYNAVTLRKGIYGPVVLGSIDWLLHNISGPVWDRLRPTSCLSRHSEAVNPRLASP